MWSGACALSKDFRNLQPFVEKVVLGQIGTKFEHMGPKWWDQKDARRKVMQKTGGILLYGQTTTRNRPENLVGFGLISRDLG